MQKKIFFLIFAFFFLYSIFWIKFFNIFPQKQNIIKKTSQVIAFNNSNFSQRNEDVLGSQIVQENIPETEIGLPESYKIPILPRKQAFNLSCEFAAASAVIYHFSGNSLFSAENEQSAEKTLMEKMGVSQNPNIGIRMGKDIPQSSNSLYENLNGPFGGIDYYGVHSPPFIDLFKKYKLTAKPISKNNDPIQEIKKAISSNHLVMAWISIGYGKEIDLSLSYSNSVTAIRGEHTIVVSGYDQNGIFAMDPASGKERHISNQNLLDAIKLFPLPLLEVYQSTDYFSFDPSIPIDIPTGLDRKILKIRVENASRKIGKGNEISDILKDFGYQIVSVSKRECFECEDLALNIKNEFKDYLFILKKDLELSSYKISTSSSNLENDSVEDAVVVIGE